MYSTAAMAFLHHLSAFAVIATLGVEVALLRRPYQSPWPGVCNGPTSALG